MNEDEKRKRKVNWKRFAFTALTLLLVAALSAGTVWLVMERKLRENKPYEKLLEAVRLIDEN